MTDQQRAGSRFLAVPVVAVALVGLVGCDAGDAAPATASPAEPPVVEAASSDRSAEGLAVPGEPPGVLRDSAVGVADGRIPGRVAPFDDRYPAVTGLDPALRRALRAAARDAADDGVEVRVNSGWRSRRYQERLFARAVADHGSAARAARWVARPGTSVHEAGGAVDVGPDGAASWLAEHGARYGLCRVYRNEPWHFERRRAAVERGCPEPYADPTRDPRMAS